MKRNTEHCDDCGIELTRQDEYEIQDPETNNVVGYERVCPNAYKNWHN